MDGLWSPDLWGTPVAMGIFTFLLATGMGVSFWGVSMLPRKKE
jgi:hypothetical protein